MLQSVIQITVLIFLIIIIIVLQYHLIKKERLIDVVYTWAGEKYSDNIRFSNNNELRYSLRSVMMFAPWVNHIYILMNPPLTVPSWFNEKYKQKITIIDHNTTFDTKHLPNTNSNAIETTLSKIPGLHEHFIYFNDDCFLGTPCKPEDFFDSNGIPFIPHQVNSSTKLNLTEIDIPLPRFPLNFFKQKSWLHIPIPRLKSQMIKFESRYSEYIEWVRSTRTRRQVGCDICTHNNLRCPCQQQHHLISYFMFKNKKATFKNYNSKQITQYFNTYHILENPRVLKRFAMKPSKFFCINDVETNHSKRIEALKIINAFYVSLFSKKPFFES